MIKKRRPLEGRYRLGEGYKSNYFWAEMEVISYQQRRSRKIRKFLFDEFYPARLGAFKGIYRKYDLPEEFIKKVVDSTFYELLLKYTPSHERSFFQGFLHRCYLYYCLTNLRKLLKTNVNKLARRRNRNQFARNTVISNKAFKALMRKSLLSYRQKAVLESYFIKRFDYKKIATKLRVSQSTVRNTKRVALLKIKKIDPNAFRQAMTRRVQSPVLNHFMRQASLKKVEEPMIFLTEGEESGSYGPQTFRFFNKPLKKS